MKYFPYIILIIAVLVVISLWKKKSSSTDLSNTTQVNTGKPGNQPKMPPSGAVWPPPGI